jgi:hypothetical protein
MNIEVDVPVFFKPVAVETFVAKRNQETLSILCASWKSKGDYEVDTKILNFS